VSPQSPPPGREPSSAAPTPAPVRAVPPPAETAPIDLLELAGGGALKKYVPMVLAAFAAAAAIFTVGRLVIARRGARMRR